MATDTPLTPLADTDGALLLTHTSVLHQTWELTAGAAVVARLHDLFRGECDAELATGRHVLSRMDRHGSFGVTTTDGRSIAAFEREPWHPPGKLPADRYHLTWIGGMPDEFRMGYGNTELVHLTQSGSISAKRAAVTVTDAGRRDRHLDVLVLLICHAYASSDDIGTQNQGGFVGAGRFSDDL